MVAPDHASKTPPRSFWPLREEEFGTRAGTRLDRATTRAEVFALIETPRNRRRPRGRETFGHLTPAETGQLHQHALAA